MEPKLIRSELDEGASTWMPYGISVDTSEWENAFMRRCNQLVEEYKARRPAAAKKKKK